ncbi:MAG: hypothetical protein ABIO35_03290 [Nitrobacter sp.]
MPTVPVTGQFGPPLFTVRSIKGAVVDAKWLTDNTGASYIIDPNTGRPYIVPRDYDPTKTAVYFSNKLKASLAGPTLDDRGASATQTSIYQELKNAFRQGGWGDLQRPLADKTDVVRAFIPAASFNLGVGAAAGGVSASEAVFFGGAYNVVQNGIRKFIENASQFGNNPDNPPHIRDGADQFNQGILGVKYPQNSTLGSDEEQMKTNATASNTSGRALGSQTDDNWGNAGRGPVGVLGQSSWDGVKPPMRAVLPEPMLSGPMAPNLSNEDIAFIDQSGNAVGELWSDIYRPRDTRNPVLRELEKYRKEAAMPAFRPDAVYSPAGDFFGNFPHGSADATTRLPTTFTTSGPAVGGQSTDNFGAIGNRSMGVFGGFMGNSPMDPAAPMRGLGAADFSGYQLRRVSSAFPDITLRDLNQSAPRPLDDEHGQADMRTLEANFLSSGNMNDAVALYNARKLIRGGGADWSDI